MNLLNRSSGVLMHISSLPGEYDIGTLGYQSKIFIDKLVSMGFTYWQILPFSPVDDCFSPYKSTSAFAGNPFFIDLEDLCDSGLLTSLELFQFRSKEPPYRVNFKALIKNREAVFKLAYQRLTESMKFTIEKFANENSDWLPDFALYTVLSEKFKEKNWSKWENLSLKNRDPKAIKNAFSNYKEEVNYQYFLQYFFYKQWSELKAYATEKGIKMIGDMPIYVAFESSDVWSHPELFQLKKDKTPTAVAGVPPDYFSEDGQLWGNPLYRWDFMKTTGYAWWIARIKSALKAFDLVRIDHFRGFSAYWSVPIEEKTAKNGKWVPGPGMDFFNEVFKHFPNPAIIAEDLGVQDKDLEQLLKDSGFPGMRIMEFAFIEEGDNIHLPHNYPKNTVSYTGTHDNNTLLGTLFNYNDQERHYALDYCGYTENVENQWQIGGSESSSCYAFIRTLWQSPANLVILPIQDLCGYGEDTRMNSPGTCENNWGFRVTPEGMAFINENRFLLLNNLFHRTNKNG